MNTSLDELNQELIVEAVLFSIGKTVRMNQICKVLDCDVEVARTVMNRVIRKYARPDHSVKIIEIDGGFQMCSKPEYHDYVLKLIQEPKKVVLSESIMDTLSIVAYKQPCTRADVEHIRGVSCDFAITKLIDYGLIKQIGKSDAPGHPALFTTTEDFLRKFGLKTIDDLPGILPEEEKHIIISTEQSCRKAEKE